MKQLNSKNENVWPFIGVYHISKILHDSYEDCYLIICFDYTSVWFIQVQNTLNLTQKQSGYDRISVYSGF